MGLAALLDLEGDFAMAASTPLLPSLWLHYWMVALLEQRGADQALQQLLPLLLLKLMMWVLC